MNFAKIHPGKIPKSSSVAIRPVRIQCAEPGTYSIYFQFGDKRNLVANKIRIVDPAVPVNIKVSDFMVPITRPDSIMEIQLENEDTLISKGLRDVFAEFDKLEESKAPSKSPFEKQRVE